MLLETNELFTLKATKEFINKYSLVRLIRSNTQSSQKDAIDTVDHLLFIGYLAKDVSNNYIITNKGKQYLQNKLEQLTVIVSELKGFN